MTRNLYRAVSIAVAAFTILLPGLSSTVSAQEQERDRGQIIWMTTNYCPTRTMPLHGQLLSVEQYPVMFNLLGTTYGGDGKENFGLPDMRGRFPIGQGQGSGLSSYSLAEKGGSETYTLKDEHVPAHTHPLSNVILEVNASSAAGDSSTPAGNYFANSGSSDIYTLPQVGSNDLSVTLSGETGTYPPSSSNGSSVYSANSPYVTLTPCIVVFGHFPY